MSFWYYFKIDHQVFCMNWELQGTCRKKVNICCYTIPLSEIMQTEKLRKAIPPIIFWVQRRMCFLMLGLLVGLKKKKSQEVEVNIRILGLTKCTVYCKSVLVFVPVLLYAVTICSFFQIKELFQVKKLLFLVFGKCQKFWSVGRRQKEKRKRMA